MKYLPKSTNKTVHPAKLKGHGEAGEAKVKSYISRLVVDKEHTKRIDNIIIIDEYGKSHQIDHILIRPNGVFVIETKNWGGLVLGDSSSDTWTQIIGDNHYSLLNPLKQNRTHCHVVNKVIGEEYSVNSLIVMTQNNAKKIGVDNVINLYHIGKYINSFDNGANLSIDDVSIIYQRLMSSKSDMTIEEHINGIKKIEKFILNYRFLFF